MAAESFESTGLQAQALSRRRRRGRSLHMLRLMPQHCSRWRRRSAAASCPSAAQLGCIRVAEAKQGGGGRRWSSRAPGVAPARPPFRVPQCCPPQPARPWPSPLGAGVLTSDPRIVPTTRPVNELTFEEATELAYFGAQVRGWGGVGASGLTLGRRPVSRSRSGGGAVGWGGGVWACFGGAGQSARGWWRPRLKGRGSLEPRHEGGCVGRGVLPSDLEGAGYSGFRPGGGGGGLGVVSQASSRVRAALPPRAPSGRRIAPTAMNLHDASALALGHGEA